MRAGPCRPLRYRHGPYARRHGPPVPDDLGPDQGRAGAARRRRDARGAAAARRGRRERAALGPRGRPRGQDRGHDRHNRSPMSSSRRHFFRDLAAAAARALPDLEEKQQIEFITEPPPPLLSDAELDRYSRQLLLPEFRELAQIALRDANVLVIGAGALGSPVATYLAGAGVGRLGIADPDVVEISNLARQHLHFTPDEHSPKAESAAAKLRFLNPEILIEAYQVHVDDDNVRGLVEQQDLIVDCTDSFETRYLVNAACCASGVPLVEGGVAGWNGLVMPIRPGETACYRCAFPTVPEGARSCAEAGVLGPAAGIVGSLQALEAIKLLTAAAPPLTDAFLQIDLLSLDVRRVHVQRRPDCPDSGEA